VVGVAAAALLAESGAGVELFERHDVAAGASGRNSGAVQHPFDPVLAGLHEQTIAFYRRLEEEATGFALPPEPVGVLALGRHAAPLEAMAAGIREACPELEPTLLADGELAALEPALAEGLVACRLHTGYPVAPASATLALAALARRRGAVLRTGASARPWIESGRVRGVLVDGRELSAAAVLVAAGPWTPGTIDPGGSWRPIAPVWGVNVELALERPPRHVLEESGVEAVAGGEAGEIFSLVTAGDSTSLGSTFLADEPDPFARAPALRERGARFVPAIEGARIVSSRVCARPQSLDGRPLIGPLPGFDGLHVAAGHGPWGISVGPATAALAAAAILGRGQIPPELAANRFGAPGKRD
jgi:glycine/D-amino acid oxidase-like deaminating enzyme